MPRGVCGDGVGNGRTCGAENKTATTETTAWPGKKRRGPRQPRRVAKAAARMVAAKALPTVATAAEMTVTATAAPATEASQFVGRVAGNWLRRFKMQT